MKETATVGGVEEEILCDDYRALEGVKLPNKIELHRGDAKYNITVTRAIINGTIGERVLDFPIKSQVKLPDVKALFKEIDDNQKAIDKIKENYAGTETEEETEYDGDGRVKKRETRESTFFYLDGDEITTLVKKDGKPLSGKEQEKKTNASRSASRSIRSGRPKRKPKRKKPRSKERTRTEMSRELRSFCERASS